MDFRITAEVDVAKVRRFVAAAKTRERALGIEIEGSE
jgi:hypothetical protein